MPRAANELSHGYSVPETPHYPAISRGMQDKSLEFWSTLTLATSYAETCLTPGQFQKSTQRLLEEAEIVYQCERQPLVLRLADLQTHYERDTVPGDPLNSRVGHSNQQPQSRQGPTCCFFMAAYAIHGTGDPELSTAGEPWLRAPASGDNARALYGLDYGSLHPCQDVT